MTMPRFSSAGSALLIAITVAYFLYAGFLLLDSISFLALLDFPPPGFSATYDDASAIFFIVDLIACLAFAFGFLLLRLHGRGGVAFAVACLALTIVRAALIYYLYDYQASYQLAPYIYKKADGLGDELVRAVLLPAQLVGGMLAAWFCRRLPAPADDGPRDTTRPIP